MKKLIVLSMVLAMAAMATAGVSWNVTYDGDRTATIELVGEDINQFVLANPGIVEPVPGVFSDLAVSADFEAGLGTNKGIVNVTSGAIFMAKGTAPAGAPVSGILWSATYTFDIAPTADVLFNVNDASSFATPTETGSIGDFVVPVPEPMTMALLGLGGLFIRRRRA